MKAGLAVMIDAVKCPAAKPVVAAYLRLSREDSAVGESNSIKSQRELIRRYVAEQDDLRGQELVDYVDDGLTGQNTDREAYQRLMADVDAGKVSTIICKDLSRIGRSMLDVDDLLMNYLVAMRVRFIAIGEGYDNQKHPLSNLELAVINLANQYYCRDIAVKAMTAKQIQRNRGEWLVSPPFGYKKSLTERNKLVIDNEAAGYVRLIFSLAVAGHRSVGIAKQLNAQGIPTPAMYKLRNGGIKTCPQLIDPEFSFWQRNTVRRILLSEAYIGSAVSTKRKSTRSGKNVDMPRPRDEWTIVPNVHEPIVSESDFAKAQEVLGRITYDSNPENLFHGIMRCPYCGRAMSRYTTTNPRYRCETAKLTKHYGCTGTPVLQSQIEAVILSSIQAYAAALVDSQELILAGLRLNQRSKAELEGMINAEERSLRILEESVTKNFTAFVAGSMTKEDFLGKKEVINGAIADKTAAIERLRGELSAITTGKEAVEEQIEAIRPLLTIEKLDRSLVEALIDRIFVYDEKRIEIVWAGRLVD